MGRNMSEWLICNFYNYCNRHLCAFVGGIANNKKCAVPLLRFSSEFRSRKLSISHRFKMHPQQFAPNNQSLSFPQDDCFSHTFSIFLDTFSLKMQRQKTRMNISPRKQRQHYFMASRNTEMNKSHVVKTCLHTQSLT